MDGPLSFAGPSATSSALSYLGLVLISALGGAAAAVACSSEPCGALQRLLRSLGCSPASTPPPATKQQQHVVAHADKQDKPAARVPRVRSSNALGAAAGWAQAIEALPGCRRLFDAAQLLEGGQGGMADILGDDHMFAAFVAQGLLEDLTGYYVAQQRKFFAVFTLGRDVCGHPRVVHGGLTAALIDESLGGLMYALKEGGELPPGPLYTVQLDVSYKAMIAAQSQVLVSVEVESLEGRKLWMTARVSDGPEGTEYATARALFIAPKPRS